MLPAKYNILCGPSSAWKPHQVSELISTLIVYLCVIKAVETRKKKKKETDRSACLSVPGTLARKQELFLVQILMLRTCCHEAYSYVSSLFSPLLSRGMPDRALALHKLQ